MDFYQRVGIVCRAIPAGKVATYGQIAWYNIIINFWWPC